jgi:hypothetical protein
MRWGVLATGMLLISGCHASGLDPDAGVPPDLAVDAGPMVAIANGSLDEKITGADGSQCSVTLIIAGVEERSEPWICPACTILFHAPMNFASGAPGCVSSAIYNSPVPPDLYFGWTSDGKFFQALGSSYLPADHPSGAATLSAGAADVTLSDHQPDHSIDGTGHLVLGTAHGDPLAGWVPSSSNTCGFPKSDPPTYTGGYAPKVGDPLPDGVFLDACGDKVRLLGATGRFTVVMLNQADTKSCAPCWRAAIGKLTFDADLEAMGIDVSVIALDVPSYFDIYRSPSPDDLKNWVTASKWDGQVLADRGYGSMLVATLGFGGWPSFALVDPAGTIFYAQSGYTDGTWTTLSDQIKMH